MVAATVLSSLSARLVLFLSQCTRPCLLWLLEQASARAPTTCRAEANFSRNNSMDCSHCSPPLPFWPPREGHSREGLVRGAFARDIGDMATLTYRELQAKAKAAGIPAKQKRSVLEKALASLKEGNTTKASGKKSKHLGLAGLGPYGALFGDSIVPEWVDKKLPAGRTDQTKTLGWTATRNEVMSLRYFFFSPNLAWFGIAMALHTFAPYDMAGAKDGSPLAVAAWLLARFKINYAVAFSYYAFFHISLYYCNMGSRKFSPGSYPTLSNMAHNIYYWSLGVAQWTWWEWVMARLWSTGVVGFASNESILSDPYLLAWNVLWVMLTPLWRDLHFYIAHRFIHIRAMYKFVHSLHHRNPDPEPFSGMSMHPIEHVYYFSNAFTPSLYFSNLSPLIFLWNFVHLTIAPGAGHSGFEDNWQGDQYHFIHHAHFECNYGSPMSGFIDQFFGTFRERLGKSKQYTGEWGKGGITGGKEGAVASKKRKAWSVHGHLGLPADIFHSLYTLFWASLVPLMWWAAVTNKTAVPNVQEWNGFSVEFLAAFAVSHAPVLVAMVLCVMARDRMSWRWPFQKEKILGTFGFFFVLGYVSCVLPIFLATKWVVALA